MRELINREREQVSLMRDRVSMKEKEFVERENSLVKREEKILQIENLIGMVVVGVDKQNGKRGEQICLSDPQIRICYLVKEMRGAKVVPESRNQLGLQVVEGDAEQEKDLQKHIATENKVGE